MSWFQRTLVPHAEATEDLRGPTELVAYVDASWNLQSVSGGIVTYQGITLKTFSRKQDVPAMSSAEAELTAMHGGSL